MVIPIEVRTPAGCEESSHPVQGAVFMGFVVPVVRAEKRARTTGYCPFTPPAWRKRPNSSPAPLVKMVPFLVGAAGVVIHTSSFGNAFSEVVYKRPPRLR